jgi:hypothetical protein
MIFEEQSLRAEPRDGWMVMLLKDLREVARKDRMDASVDALTLAIAALQRETSEMKDGSSACALVGGSCGAIRH